MRPLFRIICLFFVVGMLLVSTQPAVALNAERSDSIAVAKTHQLLEQLSSELQIIRAEITGLASKGDDEITTKLNTALDRLAATDERLIGIEQRLGRIQSEVGGFGSSFTIAIAIMIVIAFITIVLVWIQRKKYIDPVNIQLARFEAELQKIDQEKTDRLQKALQDLGTNDPLVAQLLKKYKLDE